MNRIIQSQGGTYSVGTHKEFPQPWWTGEVWDGGPLTSLVRCPHRHKTAYAAEQCALGAANKREQSGEWPVPWRRGNR